MQISLGKKEMIVEKTIETFVKKNCDIKDPKVIASVIAVATNMSLYAGQSYEDTYDVLLEAFDVSENDEILIMLDEGIDKESIYANIGFKIDFDDGESLTDLYDQNSEIYDKFYNLLESTYDSLEVKKNMV